MDIRIKTPEEIAGMREACRLASQVLDFVAPLVKAGVSTLALDEAMEGFMKENGCISACKGYCPRGFTPYPAATCISINHVVCHGIPTADKLLKKGDIVNIDVTVIKNGFYGDTSRMFIVGSKPGILAKRLVEGCYEAMWRGIEAVKPGRPLNDIGIACSKVAREEGFSVVHEYGGHGIGRDFHEEPFVTHFDTKDNSIILRPGMIFTIEPMLNAGARHISDLRDGWTVVTKDRSLSAQWEHTVLVTETGCEVLTMSEGYPAIPEWVTAKH